MKFERNFLCQQKGSRSCPLLISFNRTSLSGFALKIKDGHLRLGVIPAVSTKTSHSPDRKTYFISFHTQVRGGGCCPRGAKVVREFKIYDARAATTPQLCIFNQQIQKFCAPFTCLFYFRAFLARFY